MDTGLSITDIVGDAIVKLIETMPTTWSGNAYHAGLSATEQKVLERLVTVGIAECRFDVLIHGICRKWFGSSLQQEDRCVFKALGTDWLVSPIRSEIAKTKINNRGREVFLGTRIFEFRMTSFGEGMRDALRIGSIEIVKYVVNNQPVSLQFTRFKFDEFERSRQEFGGANVTAASSATASARIGDTLIHNHIHVPEQTAPIVNVVIHPESPMTGDDSNKKGKNKLPENPDVRDLCLFLKANLSDFPSMEECSRGFCEGRDIPVSKASDLLRQAKRFPQLWKL